MSTVEAMFHGRLFRLEADHFPDEHPRPFGDGRSLALSAWRGGVAPRIWLVPDGWESDGLEPVLVVETERGLMVCDPDTPGAKMATVRGMRMLKVAS